MARYIERKDLIEVSIDEVIEEREKSIIVKMGIREILIPRSQIGETSEAKKLGDSGILVIPRWLAKDRGMVL